MKDIVSLLKKAHGQNPRFIDAIKFMLRDLTEEDISRNWMIRDAAFKIKQHAEYAEHKSKLESK